MRHLKTYRAIRLIHRHGSIRQTADILSISPSALNRSIQAFEEEIGVDVFERIPSGVRLSAAGELLLAVIDRHLAEFDALLDQFSDLRDGLAGEVSLQVGRDIDAGLILGVVADFEAAHPGVSVTLVSDDSPMTLRQRLVDLAILTNPQTDDGVEVLHSVRVALGAWRSGPATGQAPSGLWDIVAKRLLLPPEGTGARSAISHVLRRTQLSVSVATSVTAAQLGQRMAATDGTVAIFPDLVMQSLASHASAHRLLMKVGEVQCSLLRAKKVPMTRPAQAIFALLQGRLDALGS
jgi:DNA-binding transcriptional LysR family regulator